MQPPPAPCPNLSVISQLSQRPLIAQSNIAERLRAFPEELLRAFVRSDAHKIAKTRDYHKSRDTSEYLHDPA